MPSVDNRVVNMEFNNAAFESKIKATLNSLSQLDKALKMDGASKGLSEVSAAAGKVNLNPISAAVDGASKSFLALSTIAITALSTITSRAMAAGANIVKALSLDPIMEGFQEYELNMNSIQTILANTKADGTNLEQVNAALDQLNEYSDKTIYNFAQMAKNIGTFTAAGVDLDTAVTSIKGISNLAAISGSSSEQAATAMYQLSQAISTGTVKLMDWNSVVNAGMGGEVFQKALFETGKAMNTIKDADMGTTFEEWTANGNSFRDSLQDGWLTAEVLTTTLGGISGDLDAAALAAKGFSDEQIAQLLELGETGIDAATKVRTLTGLMQTLKETVASGWSASFRILFGDFEEATQLFTGLSNSIGGFFGSQADARNELLQGWADLGGRGELLQGLENAFAAIGKTLSMVGQAFREIFPATTAQRLFELTQRFTEFTASLRPSETTLNNVKRIATGLFAALDLGWETVKAGVGFIKDLIVQLTGVGSGKFLEGTADILDFFTRLREALDGGQKIHDFFDRLSTALQVPIGYIRDFKDEFLGLFDGFDDAKAAATEATVSRFGLRFEQASGAVERLTGLWEPFISVLRRVGDVVSQVGELIGEWFGELGQKLAEAIGPGEFDAVLDALNVSLLGGIALLISKFLSGGMTLNFGDGLFDNISGAFEQLTGTLESMQTQIKADALLKIAGAVGILTASVVALSLIDSGKLTTALVAMAVGFGQLMGTFAILNSMDVGVLDAGRFTVMAAGMILLSTAVLILSGAVAIMASMSWGELARGLLGITIMLAGLSAAAIVISKNTGSLIAASIGLGFMAVSLNLLAGAVLLFSKFEWGEMVRGFAGVGAGLLIIAAAAHLMPSDMLTKGAGLLLIAAALNLLASAVSAFADMDWGEMGKGFAGIGGGLLIIAGAMHLMPPSMLLTAAGLVVVGAALLIIAQAMQSFGGMEWGEIGKGLAAMAGALIILAAATNAMSGALAGAAAILVVSIALGILAKVMVEIAKIPFGDLAKALGGIAAALAVFGIAAALLQPVIPALMGLAVAMVLLGGAFALFGVGALAVAKAFEILAEAGPEAAEAVTAAIEAIGLALPTLISGFAEGLLGLVQVFLDAAPVIAEALGVLIVHILDTMIEVIPKFGEIARLMIEEFFAIVVEYYPTAIEVGLAIITALLEGIRDNVYQFATIATEIITNFLNAIADNIQSIIAAGVNLVVQFLTGIANSYPQVYGAVALVITNFISAVGSLLQSIIDAGVNLLVNFLLGISNNLQKVTDAVGVVILTFIVGVANLATSIATAGTNALVSFLGGMTNNLQKVVTAVGTLITTFITTVTNNLNKIIAAGANAIISFIQGLGQHATRIVQAGVTVIIRFLDGVSNQTVRLAAAAADILINFLNELAIVIEEKSGELRQAGMNIAFAIADGISGGLISKGKSLADQAAGMAGGILGAANGVLGIFSPSKEFYKIGQYVVMGLANGLSEHALSDRAAASMADSSMTAARKVLSQVADELAQLDDFVAPVITPVLDLSEIERQGVGIARLLPLDWSPNGNYGRAQTIAKSPSPNAINAESRESSGSSVSFEQNIYAPKQLSTSDIYKQTRNQITLAKEELDVP